MKKRLASIVLAVLIITALCVPVFAASSYHKSGEIPHNGIYGHDYYTFSTLNVDNNSAWADVFLVSRDSTTQQYVYVPSGYMGINSKVLTRTGDVLIETGTVYNDSSAYFVECSTGPTLFTGYVCGGGCIEIYNGSGYYTASAPQTPLASSNSTNRIISNKEIETFIGYPKNSAGQTYGSCLYAERAGGNPDLISAVGVGGIRGYIKSDDLDPNVSNPMEAMEYMVNFNNNRVIPLYDKEGVRIGSFVLEAMDEEVVNGARQALVEMKAELARAS